jgi:Arm DNA-binding domain
MMRGHAYKRGASWTVVYDEPGQDGKRRQRSKGGFATRRDAQRFLTDTLARLGAGSYATRARLTVGTFVVERWLPAIRTRVRTSTFGSYSRNVKGHVVPKHWLRWTPGTDR